jgi:metal-responsive CopG/Arc/MetJ family transcriptional regulator
MLIYFFFENWLMTEIISFSIPAELRRRIDVIRGDVSRSKYIVSLLESAISKHISIESSAGKSSEAANQQKTVGDLC